MIKFIDAGRKACVKMILAPSILSADFGILGEQLKELEQLGVPWVHIDVMDGHFVPNISFAMPVIASARKYTKAFFDVHLMIEKPERYIDEFIKCGADGVTIHVEATNEVDKCIDMIKAHGKKAAIAINPDTPISKIEKYLDRVDMVLCMSVFPGYGGQKYIDSVDAKIQELRKKMGPDFDIQVDGGVSEKNIDHVLEIGANVIVAGSAIFKDDIKQAVADIMR